MPKNVLVHNPSFKVHIAIIARMANFFWPPLLVQHNWMANSNGTLNSQSNFGVQVHFGLKKKLYNLKIQQNGFFVQDEYAEMNMDRRVCYLHYHNLLRRNSHNKIGLFGNPYNLEIRVTHYCTEMQLRETIRFDVPTGLVSEWEEWWKLGKVGWHNQKWHIWLAESGVHFRGYRPAN